MAKKDEMPDADDLGVAIPVIEESETGPEAQQAEPPPSEPKRRGRPPGSGKKAAGAGPSSGPKRTASKRADDISAMAKQIEGLHKFAAIATGIPEAVISSTEAEMLATALNAVAEEYGLSLGGKTGAALQLFGAAAMVYVPRVLSVKARAEKARKEQEQNTFDADVPYGVPAN